MSRWIRAGVVIGLLTAPIRWNAVAAEDPVAIITRLIAAQPETLANVPSPMENPLLFSRMDVRHS